MRTRRELADLIASLPVPPSRRELIQLELEDHVFERIAELEAAGVPSPEAERDAVESLGDPAILRARLVEGQLAHAISPVDAALLGARTGLVVAAVSLMASWVAPAKSYEEWVEPHWLYFVAVVVALFLAFPFQVLRPFVAAQRHARRAAHEGNTAAVKRLQTPLSNFYGALVACATLPFFLWIAGAGLHVDMEGIEGPLLRTINGSFVVNVFAMMVAAASAWGMRAPKRSRT